MKTITKSSRVNSAIQVIQHMNEGMTVVDACNEVGIPRSTYYDIVKKNPEAISEVQEIIDSSNREQLSLILQSKADILSKVIEDGLSAATKPKDRLTIYLKLNELVNDLTQNFQIENAAAQHVHEFLKKGPVISPQVSRLSATHSTIMIE